MNIERKSDESKLQYHKRLVYGKLVDKTLSDIDYSELAELAYGQSYSSDVARRMFYGSRRTLQLMDDEGVSAIADDNILSELDTKLITLKKETQKFYDQRREYSKILSREARNEHLLSELCNSAHRLSDTVGCLYSEKTPNVTYMSNNSEAVLVLSDWHYGLKAENVFNKYDTDICKTRVQQLAKKVADRLLLHRCSKLHVVVLGDLVHGAIHTSARVASEELVCDQLMQVSETLAQTIEMLNTYVNETIVYITYGNHARTIQNKNDSIHRDNMERLIPWYLTQRLSTHRDILIQPDSGTEFLIIDACGHCICASHGDNDSVKTSPRMLSTLFQKKFNTNIEYILLGDKHHRESFEELGITSILCGALCGADDYANNKRLYSTPSQLLLIMTEDDGVDAEYRIECERKVLNGH